MAVLVALTIGLVWWITAWSFGIKALDAFLLTLALVIGAAAYRMVKPYVRQLMGRETAPITQRGPGF